MTTGPTTGPDAEGQCREAVMVGEPPRIQRPGPPRGTTATEKSGVSVPASTPLAALTLRARAGDLAFVAVPSPDGLAVVVGCRVDPLVVVECVVDVVVTAAWGAGVRADTVNSSTRSRRGLDHARTWAPGSE
jgi:hypothetical protein